MEGMENYTKLGKLGEGTYGVVYKVNITFVDICLSKRPGDGQSDSSTRGVETNPVGNRK